MAVEYDNAWAITASWEGPWKSYEKRDVAQDSGDYMPKTAMTKDNYIGTSFGLTAQFMKDYVNWADDRVKRELPGMVESKARQIWKDTRWKWMKGEQITDQSIATLIFDFYVNRDIAAIRKICDVLIGIAKIKKLPYTIQEHFWTKETYKIAIHPQHPKPNDNVYGLNDTAIQLINSIAPKELFDLIQKGRIAVEKNINKTRFKAFNYGDIKTQKEYEFIQDSLKEAKSKPKPGKRRLMADGTITDDTTEGGGMRLLAYGAGVFISGKFLKWW